MKQNIVFLVVLICYFLILILYGFYHGRKVKTNSDFTIANRTLPGWIAALSERATGESAWALLGLPGFAFASGIAGIWPSIGCVIGILVAWIAISWRLRDEAEKYDITTFSGYLSRKHADAGIYIKKVSSTAIVFFFFFYIGAQFLGIGKILHVIFGINPNIGVFIGAATIIPYAVYGGFRTIAYTDTIQALIMLVTLVVGPIGGIIYISYTHTAIFSNTIHSALCLAGPNYTSLGGIAKGFTTGVVIAGGLSWFFGYLGGLPQLSTRFMAIKNPSEAKIARNVGIIWTVLAYTGAIMLGWIGIAIFGPTGLQDPEYVMPSVILRIFPSAIAAILIAGAIAAAQSTASSLLILSSTELSENLLPISKKSSNVSKGRSLRQLRIITTILALTALGLTYISPTKLIFTIVGYVWAGIGDTFSIVILLSLFWKRYHGRAVVITIVFGIVFTIFWISSGMDTVITAKFMTFVTTGIVAVIATYLIPRKT